MSLSEQCHDGFYVEDVLYEVKSGKEATVYCCSAQPHTGLAYIAAKVFRPMESRGFRNDALYRQGRYVGDLRLERALRKKSRAGRATQFGGWVMSEFETMRRAREAGAATPGAYALHGAVILMEFVGDEDGPAPTLQRVRLERATARAVYEAILDTVARLLSVGRVHGDLSAFNILYHAGRPVVIDFSQAVDPQENRNAFELLVRDVTNVSEHFRKYGISDDPYRVARRLWGRHAARHSVR
jgi:RIO kinase 1